MDISSSGIVTNEYNDILLIQRDDTQAWCAPGGALESGELLTDGTAREILEETGMYTLPIRLVSADYWPTRRGALHFTFRCLIRGGEPTPSAEAPQVRFHKFQDLPQPMLAIHEARLQHARNHVGAASWQTQALPAVLRLGFLASPLKGLRRQWQNELPDEAPLSWQVEVITAVCGVDGVLQLEKGNRLPQAACDDQTAPWDVATRLGGGKDFSQIAGVYIKPNSTMMTIVFADKGAYRAEIPADLAPPHQAILRDIRLDPDVTRIEYLPEAG